MTLLRFFLTGASLVWALTLPTLLRADEPPVDKKPAPDKAQPDRADADEGKEKPQAPQAKVSDPAKPLLDSLAAAYQKIQSLELAGSLKLDLEEHGQKRTREATFTSSFQSPNRFRHEASDQPMLGSTGKRLFGYSSANNAFSLADVPTADAKLSLSELPEDHAKILPAQNLSLLLAIAKDPAAELKTFATEIDKAADESIDNKPHHALTLKFTEDERAMIVLIDPATNLIRRTRTDLVSSLNKLGRPDIKSATFTVDFTTTRPGVALKPEQFAWSPPAGAKDLAAIRAATEEEGPAAEATALVGKPAADFTLEALEGKEVTLSDLKGQVILLDFWATWCGPCVQSMPHLEKLHKELGAQGLKLFAVNLREDREKVTAFMKKKDLTMPVLFDKEGQVAKQYGVQGIPQTVLIGKDGAIKKIWIGFDPAGEQKMRTLIETELKARKAP